MRRLWIAFTLVMFVSFLVLGWVGTRIYNEMPPIPDRVVTTTGEEVQFAIGRLFLMLSRPEQPGDIETFHKIRAIVLDSADCRPDHRPNYVAQRMTGAQGDFA